MKIVERALCAPRDPWRRGRVAHAVADLLLGGKDKRETSDAELRLVLAALGLDTGAFGV